MIKQNYSILFLGKEKDLYVKKALNFCQQRFTKVTVHLGKWGDPFPPISDWEGDYIISNLSRWILPINIIKKAKFSAINFHPASPNYPGFGCNNFALYEEATEFGVTCHHMAEEVDTGAIIAVKKFPIYLADTVETLLIRTYEYQLKLFYEIIELILMQKKLPLSTEQWSRKPFTRKQLNDLATITSDMTPEEVNKRIRATTFGEWKTTKR